MSDFTFGRAPSDEPYRQRVYETRSRTLLCLPAGPMLVLLGWLALNGLVVAALLRWPRMRP